MDEDDNRVATGKNDADGNIIFDPIRYDKYDVGQTYHYSVKEVEEDEGGITFDKTVYTVDVTITDNGDGTLTATPVYSKPIAFINDYFATGTAKVGVTKTLAGRDWRDGDSFSFTIRPVGDAPMPAKDTTVTVTKDTPDFTAWFGTIQYSTRDMKDADGKTVKTKTFNYEVSEDIPENRDPSIVYDENVYAVTVTVTDNGDGSMTTEVAWTVKGSEGADTDAGTGEAVNSGDEPIPFVNTYAEGEIELGVTKSIDGREWRPGDRFDFTITPVGDAPMPNGPSSVTIKYDTPDKTAWFGPVVFGLGDMLDGNGELADTKAFTYEVREIIPKASARDPYMRYDENVYVATVTVTNAGNGVLATEVTWSCRTKGAEVKTGKDGRAIIIKNPYREIKTGDNTAIWPYIGLFAAAGLMLAVIVLRRRVRK